VKRSQNCLFVREILAERRDIDASGFRDVICSKGLVSSRLEEIRCSVDDPVDGALAFAAHRRAPQATVRPLHHVVAPSSDTLTSNSNHVNASMNNLKSGP
jgi:hypothetical protein